MPQFNLEDYETVESRLKKYADKYPDFRIKTKVLKYTPNNILIEAWVFQNSEQMEKGLYHASGIAEEVRGEGFVNKTSHVENCETSAIGRALANCNFSGDKRPSREEMAKVERLNAPTAPFGSCPKCGKPLKTKMTSKGEAIVCSTSGWDSVKKVATGCTFIKWAEPVDKLATDEYYDKEDNQDIPF